MYDAVEYQSNTFQYDFNNRIMMIIIVQNWLVQFVIQS